MPPNFWAYIIAFFYAMLQTFFNYMPTHETIGLVVGVSRITATTLGVLIVVIFGQINMMWPVALLMGIISNQIVVRVYVAWRLILKVIPAMN